MSSKVFTFRVKNVAYNDPLPKGNSMSKTKKVLSAVTVIIPFAMYIQYAGSTGALIERFPNIPRDVVKKLHRRMILNTLLGKYGHLEMTDAECDKIILDLYKKYTK